MFLASNLFSQGKELRISNIYATSTGLPLKDNSVYNCFDSSYSTFWNTINGSFEEEGIMIRLNKPTYISKIEVLGVNGKEIENLDLYIDGAGYQGSVESNVLNVFIKMNTYGNPERFSEINFYDSNEELYKVILPERLRANIKASSELKPIVAYGVINLIDGQKENAWAEGDTSIGIGQEINFKLEKQIKISDLRIWNGYHRSIEHFKSNASAKKVLIKDNRSGYSEIHELTNKMEAQNLNLKKLFYTDNITIKILDTYSGIKYKDLVISEIQFLNGENYYSLYSDGFAEQIQNNLNKSKQNSFLSKVLDKNISFSIGDEVKEGKYLKYTRNSRSILLRSNNTFVWYQNEYESITDETEEYEENGVETTKQIIADGSWYIVDESSTHIKIKIFGKMFEPRDSSDLYKGNVTNTTLRIFHEYLTITKDKIEGKNIFEQILFEK